MTAYYSEFDPYAAQWLRNLIAAGHIAPGDVDERDMRKVEPNDLQGYDQCHFFAGIGGWSYALRLAGWPDDEPVWTGSCPCQPFSVAGRRRGADDPRHLWPEWLGLIRERGPQRILGEQVPGAIGHGWLDGVSADLEAEGYAVGAVVLGAHSVGAPHIRQRLWWVAHADGPEFRGQSPAGHEPEHREDEGACGVALPSREQVGDAGRPRQRARAACRLGNASFGGIGALDRQRRSGTRPQEPDRGPSAPGGVGDADGASEETVRPLPGRSRAAQPRGGACGVAESTGERGRSRTGGQDGAQTPNGRGLGHPARSGRLEEHQDAGRGEEGSGAQGGGQRPWDDCRLIPCADGRARRVEPGIFPLVDGPPEAVDGLGPVSRVGVLKGAGNAIVPQVAAEFVRAYLDVGAAR